MDATRSYDSATSSPVTFGGNPGNWVLNATNYFGFRFLAQDSVTHYGWGSMIVGNAATVRSIGVIYYEGVADTGIKVGATGATDVPEPATTALLASGAAGLLALRRRRRTH